MATVTVISPVTGKPVEHKRVAAYCRVSTNSADQQNSYNTQVRYYTRYIKSRTEWTLVDIFADEGLSGTSSEKRENFQRMITMCELKQIDLVVTKSVSRFARNVKETLEYVRKLKLLGIGVVFEKEGINTLSMGDEMLLNTFAAIAQEESVSISQNVRFSIKKKMESGEYAPIIDEEIYESAVQCKIARKTNQMRSDSETIRFLRDRVKCGECGYPMTRTLQSSCKIKERWTCTNPECGCRVRISDSVLIEKVTMLINRIIENSALLEPGEERRKKDTPPSIQHMTEEIMAEAASPTGSEQLILDRIREIAKERYRNSNIEKELALRIAKRQTEYMKAQNDFSRDYFQSLISYVTIGSDGTVGVRTKTDTTVKEDKQDG